MTTWFRQSYRSLKICWEFASRSRKMLILRQRQDRWLMPKVKTRQQIETDVASKQSSAKISNSALLAGIAVSIVLLLLIFFTSPAREVTGLYLLGLVVSLLVTGVPIGIGMIAAGVLGVWKFAGVKGMA